MSKNSQVSEKFVQYFPKRYKFFSYTPLFSLEGTCRISHEDFD